MGVGYQQLDNGLKRRMLNGGGGGTGSGSYIMKPIYNKVTLSVNSTVVNLGFDGFDKDFDILLVFKNGIFMTPNISYSLISNTQIQIVGGGNWAAGTIFDFVALVVDNAPTAVKQSSLKRVVTISADTNYIPIVLKYNSTEDTLMFFKNGVYQELDTDYTCDGTYIYPKGVTKFTASATNPVTFNIIVIRNVIDGAVLTQFDGANLKDGTVTEAKLDPAILKKAYAYTDKAKSDLLGGADAAFDTLKELESALNNNPNLGAEVLNKITTINNNMGTTTSLATNNKSNLVAAINEVFQSGVDAKGKVVNALNNNGGTSDTGMTWDQIVTAIVTTINNSAAYPGKWIYGFPNKPNGYLADYGCVECNGKIYCIGGHDFTADDSGVRKNVYIYDIQGQYWSNGPDVPYATDFINNVFAYNNKIYCNYRGSVMYVLDTITNTWSSYPLSMYYPHNPVVVGNGKVYYCRDNDGVFYIYDIASNTSTLTTTPNPNFSSTARSGYGLVYWNGKIYMLGGGNRVSMNTVDMYDVATDTWTVNITYMPSARDAFGCTVYNGKIYCMGGRNTMTYDPNGPGASEWLKSVHVYDIANNSWLYGMDRILVMGTGIGCVPYKGHIYGVGMEDGTTDSHNYAYYSKVEVFECFK